VIFFGVWPEKKKQISLFSANEASNSSQFIFYEKTLFGEVIENR
jgi:hypothetical protein